MSTLTVANSSFALIIPGLFASSQAISGYAVDDAFTAEAVDLTEAQMGVDGQLSAGFVFNPYPMTITLMPTSDSLALFETWRSAMIAARDVYYAQASINIPGINRKYALTQGVLKNMPPMPAAGKLLKPMQLQVIWQNITSTQTS